MGMKTLIVSETGVGEELWGQVSGLLREFGVERAVLFGSRARGDFTDASDIDIAIWVQVDEAGLWAAMEQLPTIHKIDVVNYDSLENEFFRQNILRDGVEV